MLAKDLGQGGDSFREADGTSRAPRRTMIMNAVRGLVGACDHGRAARRANRAGNIATRKTHSLFCEGIDVRGLALVDLVAVTVDPSRHVLDENPEDVGLFGGLGGKREARGEEAEEEAEAQASHERALWVSSIGLPSAKCLRLFFWANPERRLGGHADRVPPLMAALGRGYFAPSPKNAFKIR